MVKIKTAIIGLGNIAHGYEDNPNVVKRIKYPTHLSALKKDKRFVLVAGSDISEQAQKAFKKKVRTSAQIYHNHLAMLKNEKPDLLVVATPTNTHYKICSDAIKEGVKIILCEKPISYLLSEAQKLVALAKKRGVILAVNYNRSFNVSYNNLTKYIKTRKWGDIQAIDVNYSHGIFNTATHLINLLEKMFGPINSVRSLTDKGLAKNVVDPTVSFMANFKATTAFFRGINNSKYRILEIDLLFSNGRLGIINDKLKEFKPINLYGFIFLKEVENSKINIDINNNMLDVYHNLYDHIVHKKKLYCTSEDALGTLTVAIKAIQSAKSEKKVII